MSIRHDYFGMMAQAYVDSVMLAMTDKEAAVMVLERFAKEVSKDTRHEAAEKVMRLHREIMNLDMDE